jgi:hypothetical protein
LFLVISDQGSLYPPGPEDTPFPSKELTLDLLAEGYTVTAVVARVTVASFAFCVQKRRFAFPLNVPFLIQSTPKPNGFFQWE